MSASKLKYLVKIEEKSSLAASHGASDGKFQFFNSSINPQLRTDKLQYSGDKVIVGKGGIANIHYSKIPFATSNGCFVLTSGKKVYVEYLFYCLKDRLDNIQSLFRGSALKSLDIDSFMQLEFDIPTLDVQENRLKVIRQYNRSKGIRNNINAQIQALEEMRSRKINDIIFQYPYTMKKLKHLVNIQGRTLYEPHQYYSDTGVPILFADNIKENRIVFEKTRFIDAEIEPTFTTSRIHPGDLLMVRVGYLGTTAVVPETYDFYHFASTLALRPQLNLDSNWLCFVLNSPFVKNQVEEKNVGSIMPQLNVGDANNFLIPTPALEIQRDLGAKIISTNQIYDEIKNKLNDLNDKLVEHSRSFISDILN